MLDVLHSKHAHREEPELKNKRLIQNTTKAAANIFNPFAATSATSIQTLVLQSSAMEKDVVWDVNLLLKLLHQAIEEMSQLESAVDDSQRPTAQKIQYNMKKALSIAEMYSECSQQRAHPNNATADSPRSNSDSPRSENSQRASREQESREMRKKRKAMIKWTKKVRISPSGDCEGMEDGHSWRKYGQKEILGATHPRAYYRCTNRNSMGCQATKLVQKSDEDPCVYDITYKGEHTCVRKQKAVPGSSFGEPAMLNLSVNKEPTHHYHDQRMLLSFQTNLKVETKDLFAEDQHLASFSFPSTSVSNVNQENSIFSSPPTLDRNYRVSTSFAWPAIPEPNYLASPPMSNGGAPLLHTPEPELSEIISATTTMIDSNFMLDQQAYDHSFNLDSPTFF